MGEIEKLGEQEIIQKLRQMHNGGSKDPLKFIINKNASNFRPAIPSLHTDPQKHALKLGNLSGI